MTLHITHSYTEGTLIDGTAKGDGSAEALKANRWRWSRNLGSWYLPRTRNHLPNQLAIRATVAGLEAAGFTVSTELEESVPEDMAAVEEAKNDQYTARAQALAEKATRKQAAADAAEIRRRADLEALPPGGEPIKIGHHSEARHRRGISRAWDSLGKSVEADQAAGAAQIAAGTVSARYNPVTVYNRIERLSAELRRWDRNYGPGTQPRQQELHAQIDYWQEVRAAQIADGTAGDYSRDTIHPGDEVKAGGRWHKVVKANQKTVSVPDPLLPKYTVRMPYGELRGHRRP